MAIIKSIRLPRSPPTRGGGEPNFRHRFIYGVDWGWLTLNASCGQTDIPEAQQVLKPSFTDSNLARGAVGEARTGTGGSA